MWEYFDSHAGEYDSWFERNQDIYEREVSALSFTTRPPRLEVGVGTGRFAGKLGYSVGIDLSPGMLEFAHERGVDCVRGSAENMPFPDSSFNTVLLSTVMMFLRDPGLVLEEVNRVTAPGGSLVIGAIMRESALGRNAEAGDGFFSGAHPFTEGEIMTRTEEANFRLVDVRSAGLDPGEFTAFHFSKE